MKFELNESSHIEHILERILRSYKRNGYYVLSKKDYLDDVVYAKNIIGNDLESINLDLVNESGYLKLMDYYLQEDVTEKDRNEIFDKSYLYLFLKYNSKEYSSKKKGFVDEVIAQIRKSIKHSNADTIESSLATDVIGWSSPSIELISISTISQLSEQINKIYEYEKLQKNPKKLAFRGHADWEWSLLPGIYREDKYVKNERRLFYKIISTKPEHFSHENSTIDNLTIMQHFGGKTRLLDLSESPFTALYFAVEDYKKSTSHGELVCLGYHDEKVLQFDSDKAMLIANLAKVDSVRIDLETETTPIETYKVEKREEHIEAYNRQKSVKELVHKVRQDKPYFSHIVNPVDLTKTYFARPKQNNERIRNQHGFFLMYGIKSEDKLTPSDVPIKEKVTSEKGNVTRIFIIPMSAKKELIRELEAFSVTTGTIYPNLDKIIEHEWSKI